jgi:pyrimidine deaminase RibD-like protein
MAEKKDMRKDPNEYMKLAVEVMKNSLPERKKKDPSPYVGAVLVFPDGTIETAYRGEFREGDHAEYALLDKKNRTKDLSGCWLFATLEPCAPGARNAPKIPCSERIVNARIAEVWFGIEDPDPKVDHGGIKHMQDNGVKVHQFDKDLHKEMRDKYKLPLPLITYEDPNLIVTFPRTADAVRSLDKTEVLSQLNDEELAGLDWIKINGKTIAKDYALHFNFSNKKAQRHLANFKDTGFIILTGRGRNAVYKYASDNNAEGQE